jgi:hypothetical protein
MIPIILTSVAAQPDMGIQVWMLGQGRAIPRNYAHTVINDAKIDWLNNGFNYNDVIIKATREAPGRHTFVTEYAGSSSIMRGILDPPGRFGSLATLASLTEPMDFVDYVNNVGYAQRLFGFFGPLAYSGQLLSILGKYLPMPEELPTTPAQFYGNIDFYLGFYREQNPEYFVDWPPASWDAAAAAAELDERIAQPTIAAGQLFSRFPYLTRLYTTLSPQHMNRDPVFSENPELPRLLQRARGRPHVLLRRQALQPLDAGDPGHRRRLDHPLSQRRPRPWPALDASVSSHRGHPRGRAAGPDGRQRGCHHRRARIDPTAPDRRARGRRRERARRLRPGGTWRRSRRFVLAAGAVARPQSFAIRSFIASLSFFRRERSACSWLDSDRWRSSSARRCSSS